MLGSVPRDSVKPVWQLVVKLLMASATTPPCEPVQLAVDVVVLMLVTVVVEMLVEILVEVVVPVLPDAVLVTVP
jgi:hypothetical protein